MDLPITILQEDGSPVVVEDADFGFSHFSPFIDINGEIMPLDVISAEDGLYKADISAAGIARFWTAAGEPPEAILAHESGGESGAWLEVICENPVEGVWIHWWVALTPMDVLSALTFNAEIGL